jgi:hypothetical protein
LPLPFLHLCPLGGCFCLRLEPGGLLSCQSLPLLLCFFVQLQGKALLFLPLLLLVARLGGSRLIHVCLQLPHCGLPPLHHVAEQFAAGGTACQAGRGVAVCIAPAGVCAVVQQQLCHF